VEPGSNPPSRLRRFGETRPAGRGGRGLVVVVTDGRGRDVAAGGLGRWLAAIAPASARGEVAIALVSDRRIEDLNRTYRRKNKPTDVLSFPAESGERTAESALGDIAIATGVARRQARAAGHSYEIELRVLALHGLLHLLGYDHDDPADEGRMARAEARLRRKGGLTASLIERSGQRRDQRLRPERAAGGQRRAAAPASESAWGWGPARRNQRLRPERAAGGQRRAAAPASESAWGWGPARSKK
jgi:probable rRNA maturation factor